MTSQMMTPSCQNAASDNRHLLGAAGVYSISLTGGAGSGKTSIIETTVRGLGPELRTGVVLASTAPQRDVARLRRVCGQVVAVQAPTLDAAHVREALDKLDLGRLDVLFLEGNTTADAVGAADLGERIKVAVLSVAAGDDKPAQCPQQIKGSTVVLLNKLDLMPHVSFDLDSFCGDVRRLNPAAPILPVSARCEQGLRSWLNWLDAQGVGVHAGAAPGSWGEPEWYFG